MRVNEYFSYKGAFQDALELCINGTLQVDDPNYIFVPVIQRFNEDPVSQILDNATGKVEVKARSEPRNLEEACILWSIIGTRDYCMDVDAYGLTDTWFVNLECVGNTIERSYAMADEVLSVLVNKGAILQILRRFDEPIDSDQAGRKYRSHNVTVSVNGVI